MSDGGRALSDASRWQGLRVAGWFVLAVLFALGVGGLTAAIDHPAGDSTRPELTARRDRAAAPVIASLGTLIDQLIAGVEGLRGSGRDALRHVIDGDPDGLAADVALGSGASDDVVGTARRIRAALASLPSGPERARLSGANQSRIERVEQAATAVESLRDSWGLLAGGALPATRLAKSLTEHVGRTLAAMGAERAADYPAASAQIAAATDILTAAESLRSQLARTGADTAMLDEWLRRARDVDSALTDLYRILRDTGGRIDGRAQAARDRADRAQAAASIDTAALIGRLRDRAIGDATSAGIAIDEARGVLSDAAAVLADPAAASDPSTRLP